MYSQDASHACTACFLEVFTLLAINLLQLCLAPQLQYLCSFQRQLFSLSLHSGNPPSIIHSITIFKGLYQWLLSLLPFLWKLKLLETLCLQTAAKETDFIQCAIPFALPIQSHWIQQVTYLQTYGPALPPKSPHRIHIQKRDIKIVANIQRAYKSIRVF